MENSNKDSSTGLTHVVLMQHGVSNEILALKAIDAQGNIQGVVPIPENFNKFLKVHQDPQVFMRFFANYLSRAKSPQVYTYFKVPIKSVWKILKEVEDSDEPNLLKNLLKEDPAHYNRNMPTIQSKQDLITYLSQDKLSYTREDLLQYKRIFFELRLLRLLINQLIDFGTSFGYIVKKSDIPKRLRFKGMVIKIPKKAKQVLIQLSFAQPNTTIAEQVQLLQKLKQNIRNYNLLKENTTMVFNPKTIKKTKIVAGKNSPLPYLMHQAALVKQAKEGQEYPPLQQFSKSKIENLALEEPENANHKTPSYVTKKNPPKPKAVKQQRKDLPGNPDQEALPQTIKETVQETIQASDEKSCKESIKEMDSLPDTKENLLYNLETDTLIQGATKPPVFQENQINWKELEQLGITKEALIKTNQLDLLLRGYKSNRLFYIHLKQDNIVAKMEARISFRHNQNGLVTTSLHGLYTQPRLDLPFFDHTFSPEDKQNLLQSGNMGRVVELTNKFTQEKVPSLISIDKLTNDIIGVALEKVKIPTTYKGVDLSEQQQESLANGQEVFVQGLSSKKGTLFDAFLQYNADKRYLEFFFKNSHPLPVEYSPLGIPTSFRGVAFTLEQIIDLENGHWVYLDSLIDKKSKPYQGYVLFNFEKKSLEFYFKQP